jgi:hypothetical protein
MEKEFIPYKQALALKELGFDETCFGYWNIDPQLKNPTFNMVKPFEHDWCLPAPLYQQVFRWFREKYDLISYVHPLALLQDTKKWCYEITNFESSWDEDSDLHTPEEAELACLIKLIEIVKDGKS